MSTKDALISGELCEMIRVRSSSASSRQALPSRASMSNRPPYPEFDRSRIRFKPLGDRKNKFQIDEIAVDPDAPPPDPGLNARLIDLVADKVRASRDRGAPVAICHGAHLIKNGLAPVLIRLVEEDWITHVATNGAGSIHDWEFALMGESCEDVRENVAIGEFGIWDETGSYLGLAAHVGNLDGYGTGESVGKMISEDGLEIPTRSALVEAIKPALADGAKIAGREGAAMELLELLDRCNVPSGRIDISHGWKHRSVQYACYEKGVPLTVHPGIGQDIIYSHPHFAGGGVGRSAMADFLKYAHTVENIEGGVLLSVGSSVMSPMIFEKSLSMGRNVHLQKNGKIDDFFILVNDLAASDWDWSKGEPPEDNPAYYVRFMKSFSRMGGDSRYLGMDNRDFLTNLYHRLRA